MFRRIAPYGWVATAGILALVIVFSPAAASVIAQAGDGLLENVPEPAGATFQAKDAIHEDGVHFWYTSSKSPAELASAYQAALEALGWEILDSGGGGDPFGLFGSGAGLTATNGGRYLKYHAGGQTGATTHIDACVWPSRPDDEDCDQDTWKQSTSGNAILGSGGALTGKVLPPGLPEVVMRYLLLYPAHWPCLSGSAWSLSLCSSLSGLKLRTGVRVKKQDQRGVR